MLSGFSHAFELEFVFGDSGLDNFKVIGVV